MVIHQGITSIAAIPECRIIDAQFIIITHYLPGTNYVFSGNQVFLKKNNAIKAVATYLSGRCYVAKINSKPKSIAWINSKKKNCIEFYLTKYNLIPF